MAALGPATMTVPLHHYEFVGGRAKPGHDTRVNVKDAWY